MCVYSVCLRYQAKTRRRCCKPASAEKQRRPFLGNAWVRQPAKSVNVQDQNQRHTHMRPLVFYAQAAHSRPGCSCTAHPSEWTEVSIAKIDQRSWVSLWAQTAIWRPNEVLTRCNQWICKPWRGQAFQHKLLTHEFCERPQLKSSASAHKFQ